MSWCTPYGAVNSLTTARLLLREITAADAAGILALDSNPAVLRYVPNKPISTLAEASAIVEYIRGQYQHNGLGRWAVVHQDTQEFLGWCGLKLVNDSFVDGRTNYYDIGYRLLPQYWGQGYASEAAAASLAFAFQVLQVAEVRATVMQANSASCRVLDKLGMQRQKAFVDAGATWVWYAKSNPAH